MKQSYVVLLLIFLALSVSFSLTHGFIYSSASDGSFVHARDTYSSSANDDLVIEGGLIWFSVPLLLKILRWKKEIEVIDMVVFGLAWVAQLLSLSALDSSIGLTIRHDRNVILLLWLVNFFVLVPVVILGFSRSRATLSAG